MPRRRGMTQRRGSRKSRTLKRRVKRHQGRKRTRVGRKRHSRRQNRGYARGTGGTKRKREASCNNAYVLCATPSCHDNDNESEDSACKEILACQSSLLVAQGTLQSGTDNDILVDKMYML